MINSLLQRSLIGIRPFIGAKDFDRSRDFYKSLGFNEIVLSPLLSLFQSEGVGFYLQNAYVKEWVDNTMVFLEVENVNQTWEELLNLSLTDHYPEVRIVPIRMASWGKECFLHDPSGILWHFGEFFDKNL
ncbi:glyoxalase [Pedobacter frigidisoli]|uniref:glyoxalase n=1 Tax=Pedobacter frigidisoli TaxID=2530455 RepID=UPI0029306C8E|nr:glyoxalase [Pedobacter frigidisoli]